MRALKFVSGLALCFNLAGCTLVATQEPLIASDCFWSGTVIIWEDRDGDGARDPGEPLLPDIRVITLYEGEDEPRSEDHTGPEGMTEVGAISQACDWENYRIAIVAPAGYDFSTTPLIAFSEVDEGGTMQFGLHPTEAQTPTPAVTPTHAPSETPELIAECFWSATVEVWEDTNGDGARDEGEPPLNNIPVDVGFDERIVYSARTGPDGIAEVGSITQVCEWENYVLTVAVPETYEATTPTSLPLVEVTNGGLMQVGLTPSGAEAPPGAGFADCDVLTREQAESVLGPLNGDPFPLESIGGTGLRGALCIFEGTLNSAHIGIGWYRTSQEARASYAQSIGERVTGIGDAAVWDGQELRLSVLRGNVQFSVLMMVPDGARDQAIQLGQIAVVRIP